MTILGYKQIMIIDTQANLPSSADNGQVAWCNDVQASFKWNGTLWVPDSRVVVKKSAVQVNGKNTGVTKIYTLEANTYNFYPTQVIFRSAGISGVTTAPTVSVGSNSSSYNNIVTASLLNTALNTLSVGGGAPQVAPLSPSLAGSTDIYVNVTSGAVATAYPFTTDLLGYYDT